MKTFALGLGPLVAVATGILCAASGLSHAASWTAGVASLCATWWITEPIPIPAVSLVPLAVLPLVGVLTPSEVGESYGNPMILLFLGGFMLSSAMERSGVHRRLALSMIRLFGESSGRRLVFGFMCAAAVLSMWISNSATVLMLLPIVLAVVGQTPKGRFPTALLLGVAYGASIGGIATPIGTPPNLVFMQVYGEATGAEVSFFQWMSWSLPAAAIMGPIAALWLTRRLGAIPPVEMPRPGAWRPEEARTLAVFAATAILWVTRTAPYGGWREWARLPTANDASVALLAVVAMFLLPNGKGERLLDWKTAVKIPWGIMVLFGGGVAIAKAFTVSGLSGDIGDALGPLAGLPTLVLVATICLVVTFMTEVTSNTATAATLMPTLAAMAMAAQIDPRIVMVPATISASFAFMLPVATPPNAIVFGSGYVSARTMAQNGLMLNLVGVAVVSLMTWRP